MVLVQYYDYEAMLHRYQYNYNYILTIYIPSIYFLYHMEIGIKYELQNKLFSKKQLKKKLN